MSAEPLSIGLMSGTSLDGIDAVAVRSEPSLTVVGAASVPLEDDLRLKLHTLSRPGARIQASNEDPIWQLGYARRSLTQLYAKAVNSLPAEIVSQAGVIGAHGQTIAHHPADGFSLQLIDGALLAYLTGKPVVTDFRSADISAGGQGAPLVPAFHASVFGHANETRAIVNIGGIANVSIIGPSARILAGFDTGPGNRLMDDWSNEQINEPFDRDGAWARTGKSIESVLSQWLADPYFASAPPKSTGSEYFNLNWLSKQTRSTLNSHEPADIQATLLELTARSIVHATKPFNIESLLVCGGGAYNTRLLERLAELIHPVKCESTSSAGIDPQQVEGAAFAWLAVQRLAGKRIALSGFTGASADSIAGCVYLP